MKKEFNNLFGKLGNTFLRWSQQDSTKFGDITDNEFWDIYRLCKPYTMTGVERMYALYNAVNYVLSNNIAGDFVECVAWRQCNAHRKNAART